MAKCPVVVNCVAEKYEGGYEAPFLTYPDIYISNRGLAYSLSLKSEEDPAIKELKSDVEEYNDYLRYLAGLDRFWDFMGENGLAVSYKQVQERYDEDVAKKVFSLSGYVFQTDLLISRGVLFVVSYEPQYQGVLPDGTAVSFAVGGDDRAYPMATTDGRKYLWDWIGDGRDFTYYLWEIFDEFKMLPEPKYSDDESEVINPYEAFEVWNQARYNEDKPNPNMMRCLKILEDMGYLERYLLRSEDDQPWFYHRGSKDGMIGLAVLDMTFIKNRLTCERLEVVLKSPKETVEKCQYILTDTARHQYLSQTPGTYGGHLKKKIYGKFDCSSANRAIKKGQYVKHRVFFADEETAIAAGFRPCGNCMKNKYRTWKEQRK